MTQISKDRFRGAYLGLFLGDSLGAPHEFRYSLPLSSYSGKLEYAPTLHLMFQSVKTGVIGQVTDDSIFSIGMLLFVITNKGWNREGAIRQYLTISNDKNMPFLGRNTRALFKTITTIPGYENRMRKLVAKGEISQSNGSLMRAVYLISLFYYYTPDEAINIAMQDTNLTNPNEVNRWATYTYIYFIYCLNNGVPFQTIIEDVYGKVTEPIIRKVLEDVVSGVFRPVAGQDKGWVPHCLYMGLRGLFLCINHSFEQALNWVIMQGGDTDTNGAVAGSLMGFYLGEMKLKQNEITAGNISIILNSNPQLGDLQTNPLYHPATAMNILV